MSNVKYNIYFCNIYSNDYNKFILFFLAWNWNTFFSFLAIFVITTESKISIVQASNFFANGE